MYRLEYKWLQVFVTYGAVGKPVKLADRYS